MKRIILLSLAVAFGLYSAKYSHAQTPYWTLQNQPASGSRSQVINLLQPQSSQYFKLTVADLYQVLDQAGSDPHQASSIQLPLPDGSLALFHFWETPVMQAPLAAKFPYLKQYTAVQVNRPQVSAKLNIDSSGFHAMIFDGEQSAFIEPLDDTFGTRNYLSFYKSAIHPPRPEACAIENEEALKLAETMTTGTAQRLHGTQRRVYRLAMATTFEYTSYFGGSVSNALAAIVTTLNRVNGIYERELAISLVLVADNDQIISTSINDPYTNTSLSTMLTQNTNNLNALIGTANYDIGHVLGTAGGGLTSISGVCRSNKARGATGSPNPIGDPFNVDYVAHEIGHQFGALHTFNGTAGPCAGSRAASSAFEPGSGSTIMAYAGLCAPLNLQVNSDSYFHTQSLKHISEYVSNTVSGGGTCAQVSLTGNTPISLPAITNQYTIPSGTPFELTAPLAADLTSSAALTYCWEEWDLGAASASLLGDGDGNARPIFRSYYPDTSRTRVFPKMSQVLSNTYAPGESLSNINRTLNFILTVRDLYQGWGGFNASFDTDTVKVQVQQTSVPFAVTSQSTPEFWFAGDYQQVSWTTAGTQSAPFNTSYVDILLSVDGGLTFPIILAENMPNNGSAWVMAPFLDEMTTTARIKVKAVGNIFFQVNQAPITAMGGIALPVEDLNFRAESLACTAALHWTDKGEKSWTHFELQRSADGKAFKTIAQIGRTTGQVDYLYQDTEGAGTPYFYRLAALATDGSGYQSPTLHLKHKCQQQEIKIYPNPVLDKATLSTPVDLRKVSLLSAAGQKCRQWNHWKEGQHQLDMSGLPAGIYVVEIQPETGEPQYLRLSKQE